MNKILLVYEDYADLMSVEGTLKKVGFDVIGLSSEYAITEQVLAFNPDLVVGSGRGGKVNSLGVGKRLKEMSRWQGKSVLIFPANFKPNPQELIRIRVDMILEAPVPPLRLVQVIGKLLGHDEAILLERLNKTTHFESSNKGPGPAGSGAKFNTEEEAIYVKGAIEGSENRDGDQALHSERVDESAQQFPLNNDTSEGKMQFRFGDRMAEPERTAKGGMKEGGEEAFPDVDLRALERELTGGGVPDVETVEAYEEAQTEPSSEAAAESLPEAAALSLEEEFEKAAAAAQQAAEMGSSEDATSLSSFAFDDQAEVQARAASELKASAEGLRARVAKYSEIVADVKVAPKSTVTRVEARRRLRQMSADWDEENLNKLDSLRREFTKALFKK
ncbi:MAG: hypothetical protein HUU57_07190 [Bdellovibrio sp.]|nr:hypothetical protein [Bdellovibrio sp.]